MYKRRWICDKKNERLKQMGTFKYLRSTIIENGGSSNVDVDASCGSWMGRVAGNATNCVFSRRCR